MFRVEGLAFGVQPRPHSGTLVATLKGSVKGALTGSPQSMGF